MSDHFASIVWDEKAKEQHAKITAKFEEVYDLVAATLSDGRAKAIVLTKLDESHMWVGQSLKADQIWRQGQEKVGG